MDESSSGKQVEVVANGLITVILDSNATISYSWELTGISNSSVLQKTGNKYEAPASDLVGAGGKEVWNFQSLRAGKRTINMAYSQPWTGGQKGTKNFALAIVTKDAAK